MSAQARAHFESAQAKLGAADGAGGLCELDAHDALDAKHKSSDAKGGLGVVRAQCLMVSGQCDAGEQLARKDCPTAYRVFVAELPGQGDDKLAPDVKSRVRRAQFDSMISACKGQLEP